MVVTCVESLELGTLPRFWSRVFRGIGRFKKVDHRFCCTEYQA